MRALFVLLSIVAGSAAAIAQAPTPQRIAWHVENPFRFFKRPHDTARISQVYDELKRASGRAPSILDVERTLALKSGGRGWAEALHEGNFLDRVVQEPCWYQTGKDCSDYVHPKSHRIVLSIAGQTGTCEWRVNGSPIPSAPQDCEKSLTIDVPYKADTRVSVSSNGTMLDEQAVAVRDLLVVGLGDSFGSGEGNPNKAVKLNPHRVLHYDEGDWQLQGFPPRAGSWKKTSDEGFKKAGAQWLHRPCHRSLYSQQVRVALQLALASGDRHQAVTYIGVACTGSEIINGLFEKWLGMEAAGTGETVTLPQLSGISKALCGSSAVARPSDHVYRLTGFDRSGSRQSVSEFRPLECPSGQARPIDLVLLSIGGNDAGFSRFVSNATVPLDAILETLAPIAGAKVKISMAEAKARIAMLGRNYAEVSRAIREVLHVRDPKRVVLTAYPPMSYDEKGNLCPQGTIGMDVSAMFTTLSKRAREAEDFADNDLFPAMRTAAATNGWTFVDQHRGAFRSHGFCARGGAKDDPAAMTLDFPRRRGPRPTGFAFADTAPKPNPGPFIMAAGTLDTASPDWLWVPYDLKTQEWKPYLPRQRWWRTPNDAFLTVNLHEDAAGNRINLTRFAAYSGAFHPTAEGHAAIADAAFGEVIKAQLLAHPPENELQAP